MSPEGFRRDGRRGAELRLITVNFGIDLTADGSVRYKQGNTEVIALVFGPKQPQEHYKSIHDRARVTCEFLVSNFARNERKSNTRQDRTGKEDALVVRETMQACMLLDLYPRTEIFIAIQVVCDDGGVLPAAINAATCALVLAGIPMKDFVTACSAGLVD